MSSEIAANEGITPLGFFTGVFIIEMRDLRLRRDGMHTPCRQLMGNVANPHEAPSKCLVVFSLSLQKLA